MKSIVRLVVLAALPFLGIPLKAPADAPPPLGSPTERVVNTTECNAYPRWLGWTNIQPGSGFQYSNFQLPGVAELITSSVAIDHLNVAHMLTVDTTQYPGEPTVEQSVFDKSVVYGNHISYRTDRQQGRLNNGLSSIFVLANTYHEDLSQYVDPGVAEPDIAVDSLGQVHAVWEWHATDHWEIYYAKKTSNGWQTPIIVTPGNDYNVRYSTPRIRVGTDGVAYIAVGVTDYNEIPWNQRVALITRSDAGTTFALVPYSETWDGRLTRPRLSLSPTNVVFITWAHSVLEIVWNEDLQENVFSGRWYPQVSYSSGNAGGMGAPVLLGTPGFFGYTATNGGDESPDVAVDSSGTAHFTWLNTVAGVKQVYYRKQGGAIEALSTTGSLTTPGIVIDSRDQLHVLWSEASALKYAARLKNPNPAQLSATWTTQLPAIPAPSQLAGSQENLVRTVAVSKDDQIHVTGDHYYTKTLDYGIGSRAGAMAPAFPGASANVVSGNARYELPLFSASGVGPTTGLSLVYNSLDAAPTLIGRGWKFNYDAYLIDHYMAINRADQSLPDQPDEAVTVFLGDGRPIKFKYRSYEEGNVNKCYLVGEDEFGFFGKLERTRWDNVAGEWKLTLKNGVVFWFTVLGRLYKVVEPTGNYVQIQWQMFVDGSINTFRIYSIVDCLGNGGPGRETIFEYEPATDQLRYPRPVRIYDPMGRRYELQYSGDQLAAVEFEDGPGLPTQRFEYAAANNPAAGDRLGFLKRVVSPRGNGWNLSYLPDGRLQKVEDPPATYLLEGDDENSTPAEHVASVSMAYDETGAAGGSRKTWLTDRRGFNTKFVVEPKRAVVLETHDAAVLAAAEGVFAQTSTYDAQGLLTSTTDRWGVVQDYVYHSYVFTDDSPHVRDNLKELWKPKGTGAGQEKVAEFVYSTDGFNNVATSTSFVTPADATVAVWRTTTYSYNGFAQVTSILYPDLQRPDGTWQTSVSKDFVYNGPRKQLTQIVDEENHTTDFSSFHSTHGLAQAVARQGGTQTEDFQFDYMGNLERSKRPTGAAGNAATNWTINWRDSLYRVTTVTDPLGKNTSYGYDVDSNLTTVTPPAGDVTTMTYDVRGSLATTATPDGTGQQWVDAAGNLRRSQDLRGFQSHFKVDLLGRGTKSMIPGATTFGGSGGGPAYHVTLNAYDLPSGSLHMSRMTQVSGSGDRVTMTYFDRRMRADRTLAPDGVTSIKLHYDELDQVVATEQFYVTDLQTCSVTFRDARNRVVRVRTQDEGYLDPHFGEENRYWLHNKAGAVVQEVDPLGEVAFGDFAHKTTYVRDARQRVTQLIDGMGDVAREMVYGDDDLVSEVRVPDPVAKSSALVLAASYQYTARKELKSSLDRTGNGITLEYADLPGQVLTRTDALGRVTRTNYHASTLRPIEVIEAFGTSDENRQIFAWQNGLLSETKVWDPTPGVNAYTAVHRRFYDQAGRLERLEAPLVAPEVYTYNDFGEMSRVTIGAKIQDQAYDVLGRPTVSTWSGSQIGQQTRSYNTAGLLQSVVDGNREIAYTYQNWRGAPQDEIFKVGGATWKLQTYEVDPAGNLTGLVDAQGAMHQWIHDAANRPTEFRYGGQRVSSTSYSPGGSVDKVTKYNSAGTAIAATTQLYDALGRMSRSLTTRTSTNEVLDDQELTYNIAHEITGRAARHLGGSFTIANDGRGQLTSETSTGNGSGLTAPPYTNQYGAASTGNVSTRAGDGRAMPGSTQSVPTRSAAYTYGPGGNRLSSTIDGVQWDYEYNQANQLVKETKAGGNETIDHAYDDQGNASSRVRKLAGITQSIEAYSYNHLNLMSSYTNSQSGANWQYTHWASGDRYAKTDLTANRSDIFVPRQGDVASDYEQIGAGAVTHKNSYVQGLGLDEKAARVSSSGERKHYVTSNVGTVTTTLDDQGQKADSLVRDAWGTPLTGSTSERFGALAQRETDSESGLIYVRNRMLDPRTGRFTQTDPIATNRPSEHYVYAENSPASMNDSMGLQAQQKLWQNPVTIELRQYSKNTGYRLKITIDVEVYSGNSLTDEPFEDAFKRLPTKIQGTLMGKSVTNSPTTALPWEIELRLKARKERDKPKPGHFQIRLTNSMSYNHGVMDARGPEEHQILIGVDALKSHGDLVVWHELGHALGLPDEYFSKINNKLEKAGDVSTPHFKGSIMGANQDPNFKPFNVTATFYARHLARIINKWGPKTFENRFIQPEFNYDQVFKLLNLESKAAGTQVQEYEKFVPQVDRSQNAQPILENP